MTRALVLLSGGIDSTTVMAIAKTENEYVEAINIGYGQRHAEELHLAKIQASRMEVPYTFYSLPLIMSGSSLTDRHRAVPKGRSREDMANDGVPSTYVPARNTVFLSLALAYAEPRRLTRIYTGFNALDYSGYPDCRPEFLEAFEKVANFGTCSIFEFVAPLIRDTKAETIIRGVELDVDYSNTWSCYAPNEWKWDHPITEPGFTTSMTVKTFHCGECDSCLIRKRGFIEAEISDPTEYRGPQR